MKKEHDELQKEKEILEKNLKEKQKEMNEKAAQKMKDAFFTDDVPSTTTTHNEPTTSNETNNNTTTEEEESIIDLDDTTITTTNDETNNDTVENKKSQPKVHTSTETTTDTKKDTNSETSNTNVTDDTKAPSKGDAPAPTFQKTVDRVKESDKPLVTIKDIALEFKEQIQKDVTRIGNIVLPPHIRGPLKEALKPVIRIGKDAALKSFDLIKRYTAILFKAAKERVMEEIRKRRETTNELEEGSLSTTNSATN